jgi:hypothetical protein
MKKIGIYLALLAILLSACTPRSRPDLERSRAQWQAAGISHYRFQLNVMCFCPFGQQMPLTVEVLDGQVVSMIYKDGTPVPESERPAFTAYATIDDLFASTEDALQRADQIDVKYDAVYGFPAEVKIDFIKNAMDDELALSASEFEVLP